MEKKKGDFIERNSPTTASHSIRPRRATVSCSTPPQRKSIGIKKENPKTTKNPPKEEEPQSRMTRNQRKTSQPISIPRLQVNTGLLFCNSLFHLMTKLTKAMVEK